MEIDLDAHFVYLPLLFLLLLFFFWLLRASLVISKGLGLLLGRTRYTWRLDPLGICKAWACRIWTSVFLSLLFCLSVSPLLSILVFLRFPLTILSHFKVVVTFVPKRPIFYFCFSSVLCKTCTNNPRIECAGCCLVTANGRYH